MMGQGNCFGHDLARATVSTRQYSVSWICQFPSTSALVWLPRHSPQSSRSSSTGSSIIIWFGWLMCGWVNIVGIPTKSGLCVKENYHSRKILCVLSLFSKHRVFISLKNSYQVLLTTTTKLLFHNFSKATIKYQQRHSTSHLCISALTTCRSDSSRLLRKYKS